MSKQWYYEVMGTVVGPLTPAELKQKVLKGHVQGDTPVRMGADGHWHPAERVKGLMDRPTTPRPTPKPESVADRQAVAPTRLQVQPVTAPPTTPVVKVVTPPVPPKRPASEAIYHLAGESPSDTAVEEIDESEHEFDFFRFVGFDKAIGTLLHDALDAHCRKHHLTLTEATRIALATYLNRKDLLEPPAVPQP